MIVDLPMPPSANHIWKSGRGRVYRSKEYVGWLQTAIYALKQSGELFNVRVNVDIEICCKGRGDADNRNKPVLDALKHAGIIEDDSKKFVRGVNAFWSDKDLNGGIRVKISPAETA